MMPHVEEHLTAGDAVRGIVIGVGIRGIAVEMMRAAVTKVNPRLLRAQRKGKNRNEGQ
jgi:hypothetical protein